MCTGVEVAALIGAGATAYSAYEGTQNSKRQIAEQKAIAAKAEASKPQESKAPDMAAISAQNAALAGVTGQNKGNSSTFLTGGSGVDPGTLSLGKATLLGQ